MDLSNKFLAFLLVVAMLISIVGTWYNVDRINKLTRLTGYATTDYGYVKINISTNLSIDVPTDTVDFGSGYLTPGTSFTIHNSNVTTVPTNWTNTSVYNPTDMILENTGNINASINLTSNVTAATFIGGDAPEFKFASVNNEANSCISGLAGWTEITGSSQLVCSNLASVDSTDTIKVRAQLKVSTGSSTGDETGVAQWTFSATAV